ncbi:SAM-dependent methyltransferase [Parasulfuritortus cantonensis]|uniref:SAM-dependent methyltransferase n=1 Tax=Parasulfuritortus cantonensis TaxID=2528202 RepID=A0A4R1BGE9_9PROT|nr:class I SAM-dependent methyltransferase [Parasulfuritortus cantonensis]TCJ16270.1 SAM-dependent methyltransferase [Parasulfuritortus cantonensis]
MNVQGEGEGKLLDYLRSMLREPAIMARLREETAQDRFAIMQTTPEQAQFLSFLVKLLEPRKALELGTFTGYSALAVALSMPGDGRLVTCDISTRWTTMARRYWHEAGVDGMIDLRLGPALATLRDLLDQGEAGTFDFIFIDADKREYDEYYEGALILAKPGGLIVLDNVMCMGGVVEATATQEARWKPGKAKAVAIMRSLNERIRNDARVDQVMLPFADGLTLVRKR